MIVASYCWLHIREFRAMRTVLVALLVPLLSVFADPPAADPLPKSSDVLREAVWALIETQEVSGQWPYEGVYRVKKELPVGYRIGGTAIVSTTLLHAALQNKEARAAVDRGLAFVLRELEHPLMAPSTEPAYDVRVWGHAYALEFLCFVRQYQVAGDRAKDVDAWIKKLIEILVIEEIPGGGWNYANRRAQASFVTAPVTQALLLARSQGENIPPEIFERARKVLEECRYETGSFAYSGPAKEPASAINKLPGSVARSAVCETTLVLLGGGKVEEIKKAVDAFHTYWGELEKRRQKPGTHVGDYKIAPYFFYYGHRYCAQAIQMLPENVRAAERERLLKLVMKVRDSNGMWNDRVFEHSRCYGTAMVAMIALEKRAPLPPRLNKQ